MLPGVAVITGITIAETVAFAACGFASRTDRNNNHRVVFSALWSRRVSAAAGIFCNSLPY